MADHETLLHEERNGVARVTLNRPEVNNAFDPRVQAELKNVWNSLRGNDDVRCVVLTGAGEKTFCTGGNHRGPRRTICADLRGGRPRTCVPP
jgi:enoyl-CoA hydratase/carnithine racemase